MGKQRRDKCVQEAQAALSKARIVSNQVEYNLTVRDIETDLLPFCQKNQITVIAYSPLAQGPGYITGKDRSGAIDRSMAATGKTSVQVALNWCIAKENVIAIPKANSVAHVEEDCGASGWRLSEEEVALLDAAFQ